MSLEIGDTVIASVKSAESYGLWLEDSSGHSIFVAIIEISNDRVPDPKKKFSIGQTLRVRIIHYNEVKLKYVGSLKSVSPS